ncbi:MAG: S1C family serine protease, partial [Gaiellaceae bacterium]
RSLSCLARLALGELGGSAATVAAVGPRTAKTARRGGALSVNQIYRRDSPGVVQVSPAVARAGRIRPRAGSGFVIDSRGDIVTSCRLIREAAGGVWVGFPGGDRHRAAVVGCDASSDLALLRVSIHPARLAPLPLGDSGNPRVGDEVVAIGYRPGRGRAVSAGVVSAPENSARFAEDGLVQIQARIDGGLLGGPLIDTNGEVIGVNTARLSLGAGRPLGFAVPSTTVRSVVAQMLRADTARRAQPDQPGREP